MMLFYYNFDDISKKDELQTPVEEKWIVTFIQPNTLKKIYYRQFYAMGFYEAYDRVMTLWKKLIIKYCGIKKKGNAAYISKKGNSVILNLFVLFVIINLIISSP